MSDKNPINIGSDGEFTNFIIPNSYLNKAVQFSVKIKLITDGWKYDAWHSVFFNGNDIYPSVRPEPKDRKIGGEESTGNDLIDKMFTIRSGIILIRDGAATETPSKVEYTVTFKAEGIEEVKSFSKTSNAENPANFTTKIIFTKQHEIIS